MAAFEDALNVVLAHPLFQNVHSMQPAAIDGTARVEEAGSQARAAVREVSTQSATFSYCLSDLGAAGHWASLGVCGAIFCQDVVFYLL